MEGAPFCPLHIAEKLVKKTVLGHVELQGRPTIPHRAHRQRSKRGRLPRRGCVQGGCEGSTTKCTQPR